MSNPLMAGALIAGFAALAGPPERLGRIDHRLPAAEIRGDSVEGGRADLAEDRLHRIDQRRLAAASAARSGAGRARG